MSCDCRTSERATLWTKECEGQRSIRQLWCLPGRDLRCLITERFGFVPCRTGIRIQCVECLQLWSNLWEREESGIRSVSLTLLMCLSKLLCFFWFFFYKEIKPCANDSGWEDKMHNGHLVNTCLSSHLNGNSPLSVVRRCIRIEYLIE